MIREYLSLDDPPAVHRSAYGETMIDERGIAIVRVLPATRLEETLAELAGVARGRGFGRDAFERARRVVHAEARIQERPRRAASSRRQLLVRLYGDGDPRLTALRSREVARVRRSQGRPRLRRLLPAGATTLVLVGDLELDAAERAAREAFAGVDLIPGEPAAPSAPPEFPTPFPRLVIHPSRDALAFVRLIERGPARAHPDYAAFRVYGQLAGALFSASVNVELREHRGHSYGVVGEIVDRADHSLLEVAFAVPVTVVGDAASTLVAELERLCDPSRVPDAELELARTAELSTLVADVDSTAGLGGAVVAAWLDGQGLDDLGRRHRWLRDASAAEILGRACRWVRPEHAPMTVTGDSTWLYSHPIRVPGGVGFVEG